MLTEVIRTGDTADVVLDHTFEFTAPSPATDTTSPLIATVTVTKINSFRIGFFTQDTINPARLNDLTGWRSVTGDDTTAIISGNSYSITTVPLSYTYFAIPTALGTPTFFENGQSIALTLQSPAVGAYTIYRSRNVARTQQTVTYTITF